MSTEITVPPIIDIPRRDDTFLVARNQMELQACQARLVSWFDAEIQRLQADAKELSEAIDIALRNRWRRGTMQKHLKYTDDKIVFFGKCRAAALEGYAIIPDLDCDVFAIRVEREFPNFDKQTSRYGTPTLMEQPPDILPQGEGEYKSELPTSINYTETRNDKHPAEKGQEYKVSVRESACWQNVQFPVIAAKARVMEATQAAMALKLFDQVAVVPQSARRKRDPMIVGKILGPKKGYQQATLTFIICWFLDLDTLK